MAKSMDTKKDAKKKPAKTVKEKGPKRSPRRMPRVNRHAGPAYVFPCAGRVPALLVGDHQVVGGLAPFIFVLNGQLEELVLSFWKWIIFILSCSAWKAIFQPCPFMVLFCKKSATASLFAFDRGTQHGTGIHIHGLLDLGALYKE